MTPNRLTTAAILLGVLSACSGSGSADETTAPTTIATTISDTTATDPTTAVTTTTGPIPTSTPSTTLVTVTTPTTTEPSPTATNDPTDPDWLAIVTALSLTIGDLQANPDPQRISEYCAPDSPCFNEQGSSIVTLAESGWHTVDRPPFPVVSAELTATLDDLPIAEAPLVVVRVTREVIDVGDARVVDANGELVYEIVVDDVPGTLSRSLWSLVRIDTGDWRVFDIEALP